MLATDSHVPCHPCFNQSQGRCTCSWHDKLSNVAAAACLCAGQSMLGVLSDCYARRTGCTQRCHHQSPNTRRADKSLRIETCTEGPLELRPGGSYPLGVPFGVSLFWEQQSQSCDNMAWGRAGAVRFKASHIPYPRSRQRLSQYLNRRPSRGLNRSLDPHLYHPPCPRRACRCLEARCHFACPPCSVQHTNRTAPCWLQLFAEPVAQSSGMQPRAA
mmetsp:Transcript_44192/g.99869  ORF Transcript_44192/g.99869 Transcript_44192/m.99869 type:complete len:216 (+) Transcript_44192:71-718(+)